MIVDADDLDDELLNEEDDGADQDSSQYLSQNPLPVSLAADERRKRYERCDSPANERKGQLQSTDHERIATNLGAHDANHELEDFWEDVGDNFGDPEADPDYYDDQSLRSCNAHVCEYSPIKSHEKNQTIRTPPILAFGATVAPMMMGTASAIPSGRMYKKYRVIRLKFSTLV